MAISYVPILKGKAAEYAACASAAPSAIAASRPLFEVVPSRGPAADLTAFANGLSGWPRNVVLSVDTGYFDQTAAVGPAGEGPVLTVARDLLARGIKSRPVFRLNDDPFVLAEIGAAAALNGNGACLRLGSEEEYPDADDVNPVIKDLLLATNLELAQVHLLIDMWEVSTSRDVQAATPIALDCLQWAHSMGTWASVTLAAGAFPAQISSFPKGVATPVHRYDAELYVTVIGKTPALVPDFGDYAINHPRLPGAPGFAPLPNLKYTNGMDWQVWREDRTLPGNQSFFTLCARVVASSHWLGSTYSDGDANIDRCARSQGGAGRALEWLRYGGNHHITHVTDRLANLGAP